MKKAVFNSKERKRLYKEAKSFMKLRAQRNRVAKEMRANHAQPNGSSGGPGQQRESDAVTAEVSGD